MIRDEPNDDSSPTPRGTRSTSRRDTRVGRARRAALDPSDQRLRRWSFVEGRAGTVAGIEKVNLRERLASFQDLWSPKVVGQVNDFHVKLVKVKGAFVWHHHDAEDELFLVLRGRITVQMRSGDVALREGEFLVVPRGTEHRPVAREEAHVLLLEPVSTVNTGNVQDSRTRRELERI